MNSLHLYLQCYMDHQYLHARACSVSEYVFDRNLEAKWVMNCLSFSVLNSSSSNAVAKSKNTGGDSGGTEDASPNKRGRKKQQVSEPI